MRESRDEIPTEVVELLGGGEWTRTTDLRIMSGFDATDSKEDQPLTSAERGKTKQNPQTIRKQNRGAQ